METLDAPADDLEPTGHRPSADAPTPLGGAHERDAVAGALDAACARIAPLWPLERFVAVNPYLGLTDHRFGEAAARLGAVADARQTMPTAAYLDAVDTGRIRRDDLAAALARQDRWSANDIDGFLALARELVDAPPAPRVPTVAAVAGALTGHDWERLVVDRVSGWAASYFDEGMALWRAADRQASPWRSWREEACIDRTPEVMGLKGFRRTIRTLPDDPVDAVATAVDRLGVPRPALELYLHAVAARLGGWIGHAARLDWDRRLAGLEPAGTASEVLAVVVAWELALHEALAGRGVDAAWRAARPALDGLAAGIEADDALAAQLVLQDALDRAEQRKLAARLAAARPNAGEHRTGAGERPAVQAVFCIDVRSEVFRRHLEAVAPEVETLGFAGFFGFPIEVVPLAHRSTETQCPVLLAPAATVAESVGDPDRQREAVEHRRLAHHVRRAWKSFKMGAVSCFSFVGPVGLAYLPKLVTDATGRTRPVRRAEDEALPAWARAAKGPGLGADATSSAAGIPLDQRVALARGALTAMSLRHGFAPIVLVVGHGATTVNNPYDTGLDCGACGGHTGEANARIAAAVLNDPAVRHALAADGIDIPADTCFVPALHDTTTDHVALFDLEALPSSHGDAVAALQDHLAEVGRRTRAERAQRMGLAHVDDPDGVDDAVVARSRDWAQVRPEWGLAGCRAFIAAPRHRTRDVDLGGRAFLHSYDWRRDEGFAVLELIMTAPMVVASWISLQYYASTVDNERFGSGNKVLHNVVGKLGVLEGYAGDLRVGLPLQSVHDGESFQHEPLRLSVVIEAPTDAMNDVLGRHPEVRELCDNGWLHLLAMDDAGRVTQRYAGDLRWEPFS